jgi:hypothetical protein
MRPNLAVYGLIKWLYIRKFPASKIDWETFIIVFLRPTWNPQGQ